MFVRLFDKLVVNSTVDQMTSAVSMADGNAVQLDIVVIVIPGTGTLTFDIQGGNDLQNWTSLNTFTATAVGFVTTAKVTAVAWKYVRVRVNSNVAIASVVAIGLNTALLG